ELQTLLHLGFAEGVDFLATEVPMLFIAKKHAEGGDFVSLNLPKEGSNVVAAALQNYEGFFEIIEHRQELLEAIAIVFCRRIGWLLGGLDEELSAVEAALHQFVRHFGNRLHVADVLFLVDLE